MKKRAVTAAACLALMGIAAIVLWRTNNGGLRLTYTQFLERVQAGQVQSIRIDGEGHAAARAAVRFKDGSLAQTVLPSDYRDALAAMQSRGVDIDIDASTFRSRAIMSSIPFVALLVIWMVFFWRLRSNRA